MEQQNGYQVVCFGETLWDFLPEGKEPGGAPMNVAFHLGKLNKKTAMISRIGNDELGAELLWVLKAKKIQTEYIQIDASLPTSTVVGSLKENHEMVYNIIPNVAWDNIQYTKELAELVGNANYFVFGTLAARSEQTRHTLTKLLEAAKTKVLDINLRPPHYNRELIETLMSKADIVKLNLGELELISSWFGEFQGIEESMKLLQKNFKLKMVLVTKGAGGASMIYENLYNSHAGYVANVVDTVGSGDSFLAAFISRLIDNAKHDEILQFANKLACLVTSNKGGCPDYYFDEIGAGRFIQRI